MPSRAPHCVSSPCAIGYPMSNRGGPVTDIAGPLTRNNDEDVSGRTRTQGAVVLSPLNMKVFARAESAEQVRAVLRGWLAGKAAQETLDDAELVATEMLTNSVRHAGLRADDVLRVRASAVDRILHLEVED